MLHTFCRALNPSVGAQRPQTFSRHISTTAAFFDNWLSYSFSTSSSPWSSALELTAFHRCDTLTLWHPVTARSCRYTLSQQFAFPPPASPPRQFFCQPLLVVLSHKVYCRGPFWHPLKIQTILRRPTLVTVPYALCSGLSTDDILATTGLPKQAIELSRCSRCTSALTVLPGLRKHGLDKKAILGFVELQVSRKSLMQPPHAYESINSIWYAVLSIPPTSTSKNYA